MENIIIRKASLEDAAEITNVHVNAWRESYQGLISQAFLDDRPLYFKNRYDLWKRVTQNPNQVTLVAESRDHGVVGFINGTHGREDHLKHYCEVWSLYLLAKYHGKRIGFNLLKKYFDLHIQKGYSKAYVWVLENNPSIKFYEKAGGQYGSQEKEENIAGQKYKELMYIWDDMNL